MINPALISEDEYNEHIARNNTQPSAPTPSITELLAAIAPHCEWLYINEGGYLYMDIRGDKLIDCERFPINEDISPKQQFLLLGAICADIESRGWDYIKRWNKHVGHEIMIGVHLGQVKDELLGTLLAFHDALLAAAVCGCTDWGMCDKHYNKGLDKALSESDGAFWDNVCIECDGEGSLVSRRKNGEVLSVCGPCPECNGTGSAVRGSERASYQNLIVDTNQETGTE